MAGNVTSKMDSRLPILKTMDVEWFTTNQGGSLTFHNRMHNMESRVYYYTGAGIDPHDSDIVANARIAYNRLVHFAAQWPAIYEAGLARADEAIVGFEKDVEHYQIRLDHNIALKAQYDASKIELQAELAAALARDLDAEEQAREKEIYDSMVKGKASYIKFVDGLRVAAAAGEGYQQDDRNGGAPYSAERVVELVAYTDGDSSWDTGKTVYQSNIGQYDDMIKEYSGYATATASDWRKQLHADEVALMQAKLRDWPDDPDIGAWTARRDEAQADLDQANLRYQRVMSKDPGDTLATKMAFLEEEFVRIVPGLDPDLPHNEYPDLTPVRTYVSEHKVIDGVTWTPADIHDEVTAVQVRLTHNERNWWTPPGDTIDDPAVLSWDITDTGRPNVDQGWRDSPPRGFQARFIFGEVKGPWSPTAWCERP